eukprot:TRINITY_DN60937_c0_g1_i1.p1 TRINITY_DN60937_c0_g1~~TRINITY_DN60937_c0_g1_i1.p1  ORF type:complete len:114 (-),score=14.12 TRINITY_DN60937_c0_g1_i1:23-364(-)
MTPTTKAQNKYQPVTARLRATTISMRSVLPNGLATEIFVLFVVVLYLLFLSLTNLFNTVSYTHLTLPTILLVQISVVAVSLKKKKQENNKTYNDQCELPFNHERHMKHNTLVL